MAHMILRLPDVIARTGLARSTIYKAIAAGVWTRPVLLSARAVGWPVAEVDAILGARVAGKTDDDIRALVIALQASRARTGAAA